jgi:hypothetical protein
MTEGLRETASLMAIAALLCVGATVFGAKPAKAADLGGDCCADLEDRVAELEATTVRKGNKKVSVQIYGKVNYATMFWNDGGEQNTYVVNNYNESTRTGIKGSAKIAGDWSAGYRLEWEYRPAASNRLNQFNDDNAFDTTGPLAVRWSQMYLANKTYGTLNWGLTATPKYDITKYGLETISTEPGEIGGLSDTLVTDFRMNDAFFLRQKGFNSAEGLSSGANGGTALSWQNIARCYSSSDQFNCASRRNGVSYVSPDWYGLNVQYGYFEDDLQSAAIRYKNTFAPWGGGSGPSSADTWQFAAGAAWERWTDERLANGGGGATGFSRELDEWAGSAALKHKPTGLFVVGVFSIADSNDSNVKGAFNGQDAPQMTAWNVQGGVQRPVSWFGLDKLGETALWGGFSDVNDGFAPGNNPNDTQICQGGPPGPGSLPPKGNGCQLGSLGVGPAMTLNAFTFPGIGVKTQITSSDVNEWFIALDQSLAAAAMHLYIAYEHFDANISLIDINRNHVPVSLDDFDVVYSGGRIYF